MNFDLKDAANRKITVIFGVLLFLSLVNIVSLAARHKHIKALTVKISQQALIIEEKNKQLEADKVQYTSLAARLHKEVKKVGDLETELKKYRRSK